MCESGTTVLSFHLKHIYLSETNFENNVKCFFTSIYYPFENKKIKYKKKLFFVFIFTYNLT
jgi:hypothetical protein